MKDGSRLHKLDAFCYRFILMKDKLIFLGNNLAEKKRWKFVDLSQAGNLAEDVETSCDSIGARVNKYRRR